METVWELTDVFTDFKSSALSSCAVSYSIIFLSLEADPDLTFQSPSCCFFHCQTISRENCTIDLSVTGGPGQSLLALFISDTHSSWFKFIFAEVLTEFSQTTMI